MRESEHYTSLPHPERIPIPPDVMRPLAIGLTTWFGPELTQALRSTANLENNRGLEGTFREFIPDISSSLFNIGQFLRKLSQAPVSLVEVPRGYNFSFSEENRLPPLKPGTEEISGPLLAAFGDALGDKVNNLLNPPQGYATLIRDRTRNPLARATTKQLAEATKHMSLKVDTITNADKLIIETKPDLTVELIPIRDEKTDQYGNIKS